MVECALQVGTLLYTGMSDQSHYELHNTHCHSARALHSSADDMLLFPSGTRKPSLSMSPATSLVRTVDLFICGQDTDHAPVTIYTESAARCRTCKASAALQPSVVLVQTMALNIFRSGKHQMRLFPAKYVAKALCKGGAM